MIRFSRPAAILDGGALGGYPRTPRRLGLQRLFSSFPGGWPGLGLLLLRAAIGTTSVIQGAGHLAGRGNDPLWVCLLGLVEAVAGLFLLAGFLTPLASVLAGASSLGIALLSMMLPNLSVFDSGLTTVYVAITAAAVAFLGPGAFSVDSHLFGRREIIISRGSRTPKS